MIATYRRDSEIQPHPEAEIRPVAADIPGNRPAAVDNLDSPAASADTGPATADNRPAAAGNRQDRFPDTVEVRPS